MALSKALDAFTAEIDAVLDEFIESPDGPEARLFEAMRYAVLLGGKRLRPYLVVASADMFGVRRACSMRVAAAVEMVHAYSLVHDDLPCMDDDDLRRGHPATHKKFDEATAVLAGDTLLTQAFEILAGHETHEMAEVRSDLVHALALAAGGHGMTGGQMIDLLAEDQTFELPQITRLQAMKTGALLAFACEAGAILGRASGAQRMALHGYAHDLGRAFQIKDDLLDIEGDAATVGKRVGKDAAAGKATFVSILGVERARQQAQMLADQAAAHLHDFGADADQLRALARFVVERES
ncbi:MAG: polyprenyl synthetase family protein [Proteobacteria bacterium]|nr:polyprenyl synthetase family protein [Pseudomonadota bacterium]